MKDPLEMALEHARSMYIYHADQRHKSLNFYFTLATALMGGIGALFASDKIWIIAFPIAPLLVTGLAVIATAVMDYFTRLDGRNQELVNCDKDLLRQAEKVLGRSLNSEEFQIIRNGDELAAKNRENTYGHLVPVILRVFQAAALIALVASWGYWVWAKDHPPVIK